MADTIRELIIAAIASKLVEVRTANGYLTEMGQHVYRAAADVSSSLLPAISIFPRVEESERQQFGKQANIMPVELKGLSLLGTTNSSVLGEKMLGDLISCMLGTEYTRTFTSGGTYQIVAGNTITGATSHATGVVQAVTLTSGSWAGGNAAGTIRFRNQTGTFQSENLDVGTNLNVATIAGAATQIQAKDISGGGYVDDILYAGGGVEDYPATKEEALIVTAIFNVAYSTNIGNPYSQA
jgi:hypothetical protein